MANLGAGEVLKAYLVKKELVTEVDTQYKSNVPVEEIKKIYKLKQIRYRYLTNTEATNQPISNWLKGKFDKVIFTSETDVEFKERDKILFDDGRYLFITSVTPQVQHGAFLINRKPPHILELS